MTPATAGQIALTWSAPADPCLSAGPIRYRVYSAATANPSLFPGSFPTDPPLTVIGTTAATTMTIVPASGDRFYLVVGVGGDGAEGPAGAYGP